MYEARGLLDHVRMNRLANVRAIQGVACTGSMALRSMTTGQLTRFTRSRPAPRLPGFEPVDIRAESERMASIGFLLRVLRQRLIGQERSCPYCRCANAILVGRKKIVLELQRCDACGLMYRWPKDTVRFNHRFYQWRYRQGMTTGMPDRESLEKCKKTMFRGTEQDFADKIAVLKSLMPWGRVLDYGCSWGYGTLQLVAAGYDAFGFEISQPRAAFGRARLGVKIISSEIALDGFAQSFDAVFASHVLEHLPAPSAVFDRLAKLLKPNGLLLAFVPNCDGDEARRLGVNWGPMCCEKHPLALDPQFLERILPRHGFQVSTFSNPYAFDSIKDALNHPGATRDLHGDELMICARKITGQRNTSGSAENPALGG